jgi:hypothetical protein
VIRVYLISTTGGHFMGRSLAELAIQARTPLFYIGDRPIYPIMGGAEDGEGEEERPGNESPPN